MLALLGALGLGGVPPPHPSPGADAAGAGHPDPVATAFFLCLFFGPAMFVCFTLGLGHLIDWFEIRGWRPEDQRRKLK
jgi:hypothetical protein